MPLSKKLEAVKERVKERRKQAEKRRTKKKVKKQFSDLRVKTNNPQTKREQARASVRQAKGVASEAKELASVKAPSVGKPGKKAAKAAKRGASNLAAKSSESGGGGSRSAGKLFGGEASLPQFDEGRSESELPDFSGRSGGRNGTPSDLSDMSVDGMDIGDTKGKDLPDFSKESP